jgi:hypothetical protein
MPSEATGRRLRPVLVAVGWIVALIAAGAALSFLPIRFDPLPAGSPWRFAWQATTLALAFLVASPLVGGRLAGLSWTELGWRPTRGIVVRLVGGAGLGVLMAAAAVGLSLAFSGATLGPRADWAVVRAATLPYAVALLGAALFEELVFRGAPLRLLARALGAWPATLVLALGFAAAHVRNPDATPFGTVNIALAAVLLSVAFFSRGGIPLAWGLHFGWNAGVGLVFSAPVSGIPFAASPLAYTAGHHAWVDGGAFGPEGGLVGTIAMAAGVAAVVGSRVGRPKLWMAA